MTIEDRSPLQKSVQSTYIITQVRAQVDCDLPNKLCMCLANSEFSLLSHFEALTQESLWAQDYAQEQEWWCRWVMEAVPGTRASVRKAQKNQWRQGAIWWWEWTVLGSRGEEEGAARLRGKWRQSCCVSWVKLGSVKVNTQTTGRKNSSFM